MTTQISKDKRLYDTVIFDLDGTLLDTLEDLQDAVNFVLLKRGYPLRSLEEIRSFVGNGIFLLMERAVPEEVTEEELQRIYLEFREYYTSHCKIKTKPYEGVKELLQYLKDNGYLTAIVSNKNDAAVKQLSQDYFPGLIDIAVGQREGIRIKPAPDTINEVLKLLDTDSKRTLYVGDSEVDQATAENASMDYVLVDWGFRSREQLMELKPKRIVSHSEALLQSIITL